MTRTISQLFADLSAAQELVLRILSFLEREEDQSHISLAFRSNDAPKLFPRYAVISRDWQYAVERITFSSITLKSIELGIFSDLFKPVHRRATLGLLTYEIVLPEYNDHACAKFESTKDKEANDLKFSNAVHGLFAELKSWEESTPQSQFKIQQRPLKLSFHSVYSLSDMSHRDTGLYDVQRQEFELGKRKDLWEHRYEHSVIKLQRWEELPILSRVNNFGATLHWDRVVEPQSISRVASKFPSLEVVDWLLSDDEKKNTKARQQLRSDFARSLDILPRDKLKSFTLGYHNNTPANHHYTMAKALASASEPDELSLALNKLSQSPNLSELFLTGPITVSPALYEPASPGAWLRLEEFHLIFNICTPNGDWYFERDPNDTNDDEDDATSDTGSVASSDDSGLESDEEDSSHSSTSSAFLDYPFDERKHDLQTGKYPVSMFRKYPATEKIFALLEAFATAAMHMPVLRRASLKAGQLPAMSQFEVFFLRSGEKHLLDSAVEDSEIELVMRKPRLYFQTGRWRGEEDGAAFDQVIEMFQKLALASHQNGSVHENTNELLVKFFEW